MASTNNGGYNPDDSLPTGTSTNTGYSQSSNLPAGTFDMYGRNVGGTYDASGLGDAANQPVFIGQQMVPTMNYGPTGHNRGNDSGGITTGQNVYSSAYATLQGIVNMSTSNPGEYANLQADAYAAGLYGSTKPNFGHFSAKDGSVFGDAMKSYLMIQQSGSPMTFAEYLANGASQGAANGLMVGINGAGGGGGGQAPTIQLMNPDVLGAAGDAAAQSTIHRNLTASEQAKFVASQHAAETAQQMAQPGQTVETATDPQSAATQEIKTQDNPEYTQALSASYMDAINSLLGVK